MGGFFLLNELWFRYLFVIYYVVIYFSGNYFHSSFALSDNEFIVINPNFPFNKYNSFDIAKIQLIDIFPAKDKWYINLFNSMVGYTIILQTVDNKKYNIRCMLEINDDYSEIINPYSTIDDLYYSLENRGLNVEIKY